MSEMAVKIEPKRLGQRLTVGETVGPVGAELIEDRVVLNDLTEGNYTTLYSDD